MAVMPDSAFAQGSKDLVVAIPADLGGWDQDYLAFDLVGLAMFKNCYPYMIDYGVKSTDDALVMDTENIVPVFAESWESDSQGQIWTLKIGEVLSFQAAIRSPRTMSSGRKTERLRPKQTLLVSTA